MKCSELVISVTVSAVGMWRAVSESCVFVDVKMEPCRLYASKHT